MTVAKTVQIERKDEAECSFLRILARHLIISTGAR